MLAVGARNVRPATGAAVMDARQPGEAQAPPAPLFSRASRTGPGLTVRTVMPEDPAIGRCGSTMP
jgi:hypothetical protein